MKFTVFDDWAASVSLVDGSGEFTGSMVVHRVPLLDALDLHDLVCALGMGSPRMRISNGRGKLLASF